MTVLLLDAHLKSSLAAIRSLGNHGVPIVAGSHVVPAMGLYSRHIQSGFLYPSPLLSRSAFVDAVIRQTRLTGRVVLLAFSDSTLLPLVEDERFLQDHGIYVLPASRQYFDIAFDKARTLELAWKIGVGIPQTYLCKSESDFSAVLRDLTYPVVVKPRRSVSWKGGTGAHRTARFAFLPEDVRKQCATLLARTGEFPIIQDFVYGEEAGVEFLCDDGRVLAACAHRRIRSESPIGGPGAVKETVPLSYQGLGTMAQHLVTALRWSGPIMIEFKIDRLSGIPKLMEINGRFWGSLPLATAAGVDFPYLYYQLARGESVFPSLGYREGIVSRHFVGDVKNLLQVLVGDDPMRPLVYPGRLRALRDFLVLPRHCKSDVLDWNDWKPAAVEIVDVAKRILSASFRRTAPAKPVPEITWPAIPIDDSVILSTRK
jgi:predicted ATP-grasp superfamily ATP-dependent carboligase